jgi:transcriptional regulator with XRE-family HTH domain
LDLSVHERASQSADLARAVRVRREQLGLRQDELADLANCSARFVHAVEHAKVSIQLDKLLAVLRVLGFDIALRPGRGEIVVEAP